MSSIFRKELRDILRWLPLGLFIVGLLCWREIPAYSYDCSRHSSSLAFSMVIGSSLFALALGLLQTHFDLRTDARGFLLHRPIAVSAIFKGKLLAGFVVHTLAWLIPVLWAAIYLESIGPEKLPVTWTDMLLPAVCCWVSFLFYPASIWMACRNARWIGTKCLPLALPPIAVMCGLSLDELSDTGNRSQLSIWGLILSLSIIVLLAAVLWKGVRHAFVHQTFLPSQASDEARSWPNVVGLTTAAVLVTSIAAAIPVEFLPRTSSDVQVIARVAVSDGQLWEVEETWPTPRIWNAEPISRRARRVSHDEPSGAFQTLPDDWTEQPLANLYQVSVPPTASSRKYQWFSQTASKKNGDAVNLFLRSGRLYVYGQYSGLLAVATPQGVYDPSETAQGAFHGLVSLSTAASIDVTRSMSLGGHRLLADQHGIYQLNFDAGEIRKLSDLPAQSLMAVLPSDSQAEAILLSVNNRTLRRFQLSPIDGSQPLPSSDSELVKATYSYPLSDVQLTNDGVWELPDVRSSWSDTLFVASLPDDGVLVVSNVNSKWWQYEFHDAGGNATKSGQRPILASTPIDTVSFFTMPPVLIAFFGAISTFSQNGHPIDVMPARSITLVIGHALLAACGIVVLLRRRVASKSQMLSWMGAGLCLGVGTWLGLLASWPGSVTEPCTGCGRRRRIESDRCGHCGAAWEPIEHSGPHLIGPRDLAVHAVRN
ncbi:MAG: hypothetical protein R3C59_17975 [Planctomycetaceae bacterium]